MRPSRTLTRAVHLLALVGLGALAAPASRRPAVDTQAMREAISAAAGDDGMASPASYANYLRAKLLSLQGNHRDAVDSLRLALATDENNPHLLTRLGEEYARLGDLTKAERELRRVVKSHPSYYAGRLMLGRVLMEAGKPARARMHLRRAIQLRPREPEAYLVLAQLHLDGRSNEQAVKVVEELAAALPGEASGYRRLGLALAERGDSSRAGLLLSRAIERDPGDVESLTVLAQIREKAGQLSEAEEALARTLERDPDNQAVLLSAGRLALRLGSSVRARAYFDRLLSISGDPELTVRVALAFLSARDTASTVEVLDTARKGRGASPRVSYYAGLVHERLRHFDAAATAYAEVPLTSEVFPEARARRAVCLSQAGQHEAALALLREALAERPDDAELWVHQARAQERAGAPEDAVATLKEAIARKPSADLHEALASTLQRQKRSAEAIALLRDAIAREPREPALRYLLANVLLGQGDENGALTWMRSVLELEPENAAAMNFIGYLLAQRGRDFVEAERLVRRALQLRPDTGSFLDSLGWIHYQRGDYPRALQSLERAAELEPEEPVILEHLGDAYHRVSRPGDAAGAWRRALELLALNPEAADPPDQRALIERKLKLLSTGAADR
ncbi:tetratricopeptide repeat protein [Archangium lansingense]|uniref:Tetratricopeptide repeat protein n=1 Tax=Archangium lansingense TaxID=2995310 RepID=A0ABT4AD85_9BACT|nr:tetratricopeptide repeat protein [Archangium lansinium]MCY1079632.1 tetratricopeptide repeat protein [Archangium lansinium]